MSADIPKMEAMTPDLEKGRCSADVSGVSGFRSQGNALEEAIAAQVGTVATRGSEAIKSAKTEDHVAESPRASG